MGFPSSFCWKQPHRHGSCEGSEGFPVGSRSWKINVCELVSSGLLEACFQVGHHPCGIATDDSDPGGVLKLTGGLLEAEIEGFFLEVAKLGFEFLEGKFAERVLGRGHG